MYDILSLSCHLEKVSDLQWFNWTTFWLYTGAKRIQKKLYFEFWSFPGPAMCARQRAQAAACSRPCDHEGHRQSSTVYCVASGFGILHSKHVSGRLGEAMMCSRSHALNAFAAHHTFSLWWIYRDVAPIVRQGASLVTESFLWNKRPETIYKILWVKSSNSVHFTDEEKQILTQLSH